MSSFWGIISLTDTTLPVGLSKAMKCALSHWRFDAAGELETETIAMGHLKLFDTPEAPQEIDPIETDHLIMAGDCRIDNRAELAPILKIKETVPDSQFVVAAFDKWGVDCCTHLIGDFSLLIWDKLKRQAFIARDPMGVKPCYYVKTPDYFAVASEIKALFCVPGIKPEWHQKSLKRLMSAGLHCVLPHQKNSQFKDVYDLSPGHYLTITAVDTTVPPHTAFWSLDDITESTLPESEIWERLNQHIEAAITCRMRCYKKVGAELSGGLDSALITAIAAKHNPDIYTFTHVPSINASIPTLDEKPFATKVTDYVKIKNRYFIDASDYDPENAIREIAQRLDGPHYGIATVYKAPIWQAANQAECDVLLSGFGGDEALSYSGAAIRFDLARQGKWRQTFNYCNASFKQFVYAVLGSQFPSIFSVLLQLKSLNFTMTDTYAKLRTKDMFQGCNTLIKHNFLGGKRASYISYFTVAQTLGAKEVSYRFPLLDIRLLRFILSIPIEIRYPIGSNRYPMRRALRGIVPDEIINRKDKAGLIFPAAFEKCIAFYFQSNTGGVKKIQYPLSQKNRLRYKRFMMNMANKTIYDTLFR